MSLINFATLADEVPELQRAWPSLRAWFERNPKVRFVDLRRLAREIPDVPTVEMALAMHVIVRHGWLKQVYRVASPDGNLVDQDFDSPSEIPETLPDRFHTSHFHTSEGDIVPGFLVEKSGV